MRYSNSSGRVPWWWVAITHNLESGANFKGHLHNGDPLTARTRQVPAGRPLTGTPPFTWEESARDALQLKGLFTQTDWNIARCLFEWERYNGFGYVARRINSPYVWSFTTLYDRGKYVADGKFDSMAVSGQCGAAATLKAMIELDIAKLPAPVITEAQKEAVQIDRPLPQTTISPVKPKPVRIPPIVTTPSATHPQWDIVGMIVNFVRGLLK
jgi:lysozyme family protein